MEGSRPSNDNLCGGRMQQIKRSWTRSLGGTSVKEILIVIGFIGVWFVLNRWVLPRFGVQT